MCWYEILREICRGGEIGRHAALRGLWEKSRAGSSPALGIFMYLKNRVFYSYYGKFLGKRGFFYA